MKQATIQEAMDLAQRHHQAGRLADARAIYARVLAAQPNYPQAQFDLGMAFFAAGRIEESAAAFARAAAVKKDFAEAWNNLAHTMSILGRFEQAISAARQAIAIHPDFRRLHIATELLQAELSRWPGTHFLEVRESNVAARRLYEGLGFQAVGERPAYYDNPPETGIVMKILS